MEARNRKKSHLPLDTELLELCALSYVKRYFTSRAKLGAYLESKIRMRGWSGESDPGIEALIERFTKLGYVDDRAFAEARAAAFLRRGYGERRLYQELRAAGIEAHDIIPIRQQARLGAWEAALRFAERKRIGPFAKQESDQATRRKALAAMLRAGHSIDIARKLVEARIGEIPESVEAISR